MRTLEVEFLGEFESIFENALVYESGDQLGTFGEITLDKKILALLSFSACVSYYYVSRVDTYLPNIQPALPNPIS
jgi:hypothetical protein